MNLASFQKKCHICAWFFSIVFELSVKLVLDKIYYSSETALTIQLFYSEGK